MIRFVIVSYACVAAACVLGCGNKGSATTPPPTSPDTHVIPFGVVVSLSGNSSALGLEAQKGVNIAVAQLNAIGGVLGSQLAPQFKDDGSDANATLQNVTQLQAGGVAVGVGPSTGPAALALAGLIHGDQILYISPSATSQDLDTLGGDAGAPMMGMTGAAQAPVLFRTAPSDNYLAAAMVQYATTTGNPPICTPAIVIVAENDDYGNTIAADINTKYVADQYKVIKTFALDPAMTAVSALQGVAAQVGASAGDGTAPNATNPTQYDARCQLVVAQPQLAGLYMQAFRNYVTQNPNNWNASGGWSNFHTLGSDGFRQTDFISYGRTDPSNKTLPTAGEGSFAIAANTSPDPTSLAATQQYSAFYELYEAWNPGETPGSFASTAYDATILLAAAMVKAGSATDLPGIRRSLFAIAQGQVLETPTNIVQMFEDLSKNKNVSYNGASGPCNFLPTGGVLADFGVWQIRNADYVLETTFSPSDLQGNTVQ